MTCYKLSNFVDVKALIHNIGSTQMGNQIMSQKAKMNFFYIKNIKCSAANILKQEALSLGGDFATPKGLVTCEKDFVDGVLLVSNAQLKHLNEKLLLQPFSLRNLSSMLEKFLHLKTFKPKLMGVINCNEDSFFEHSRFKGIEAVSTIQKMIAQGANMIDIGGVSSRPGSLGVSDEEELDRLKPLIDEIYKNKLYEYVSFSLDSYSPLCVKYALDNGFKIINDITALQNDEVAKICGEYDAYVCLMHMQSDPQNMQNNPNYEDVMKEVDDFFTQRIKKAKSYGVNNIYLDVGIGFGKTLQHNLTLLKHQEHFLHHGYELLVGASRKSIVDKIIPSSIKDRLPGTIMLHMEAIRNGASIIRCHDVKEHKQALSVYEALQKIV